ncbi:hypothetical protein BP6252_07160 [Coleophoma cylindrospora]|uniref:Uncharacterized protein n=1 Tax=Coleophoma cylindrospora TaxID=1849047 RepID=A0A3D8RGR3_9HELO|nr:hypothetical protein BP6252_07160 [Coleophoma cylindrospora]
MRHDPLQNPATEAVGSIHLPLRRVPATIQLRLWVLGDLPDVCAPQPGFAIGNCGTRLIHSTPGKDVVSVKGGAIEGLEWGMAKHIWCKRAMVPIPEGVEQSPEEPEEDVQADPRGWGQDDRVYGSGGSFASGTYGNRGAGGCGEKSVEIPTTILD